MTTEQLLAELENLHDYQHALVAKKNKDYAKHDAFENFTATAAMADSTPEQVFLLHIANKVVRIRNLTNKENSVKGESIEDSLHDLANYANLMLAYLHSKTEHSKTDNAQHDDISYHTI